MVSKDTRLPHCLAASAALLWSHSAHTKAALPPRLYTASKACIPVHLHESQLPALPLEMMLELHCHHSLAQPRIAQRGWPLTISLLFRCRRFLAFCPYRAPWYCFEQQRWLLLVQQQGKSILSIDHAPNRSHSPIMIQRGWENSMIR